MSVSPYTARFDGRVKFCEMNWGRWNSITRTLLSRELTKNRCDVKCYRRGRFGQMILLNMDTYDSTDAISTPMNINPLFNL